MGNSGTGRRARGEVERLPSGSLRVRVYAGVEPDSRKRRYLTETVPAGPEADRRAEAVRARLLDEARGLREAPARPADAPEQWPIAGDARPAPATGLAGLRQRGPRRGELTVAAVARLAGVSAPTVSKVLNGRAGVASETRRRVEDALREHGYRRPEAAVRAPNVEVVFYGMQSFLAVEIMRGVGRVVGGHELAVGFTDAVQQTSSGRSWAHDLLARRPFGVIAVHLGFTSEQHALLAASGIPMVVLDPTGEPDHPVPSVGATNWSGGIAATRHLLDLGHRRIAVVTGPVERLCARARLEGARAAMDAHGAGLDERLVRVGRFAFEDGLDHARELLRLPDRPTAVVCGNDLQALGVYEAARQAGLRVPQDLSVVGFDDIPAGRWCGPPLTTVRQPAAEMGATAAELLLSLVAGRPTSRERVELATTLVVRDSTAPPC
ncbi:LacI family DNA-binding transcriptional regulator [Saccharothrix longispora]|uniref:LacI family DNA-binding transcriptional regulator n=1 Tax=Saccharothrix longispora TaxID=33920 RepID=UPI0028FD21F4|nr:substrate-binding domain-containing protein [Saccharothrix longispora]MDU0293533.1 substrate-binding domain-containing protein [Saccharothrix longispora]